MIDAFGTGEMLSISHLPEELIPRCMDVLVKITNSEHDLIRVVVDVVTELRAAEGDEDVDMVSLGSCSCSASLAPRLTQA